MMTKEISCPRPVEGEQLIYFCNLSFAISHVIVEVQDGGKLRSRDSVLISHSSSKLASLFGQDRASFLGGNESLTYTAPKQPKKEKPGERLINYIFMCGVRLQSNQPCRDLGVRSAWSFFRAESGNSSRSFENTSKERNT